VPSQYDHAAQKDGNAYDAENERLIVQEAQPTVATILSRYLRQRTLTQQDAQDVAATVNLRLILKMRRAAASIGEKVEKLDDYVAVLTYNVVNDHLRRRYPEKVRLKNRLRYVLSHDARFSVTSGSSGLQCGLRHWPDSDCIPHLTLEAPAITLAMRDARRPAEALIAIFNAIGRPVRLDDLVALTATLWGIADVAPAELSRVPTARHPVPPDRAEARQYLRVLWREIRQLRPLQRKALLLNLRESGTLDAISLLILTGTASFGELAEALEMSEETLAGIWNDLPLDDFRIAAMLDLTRQQVINLRKSARARLSRRMP
jgi:DNA-directed RNA polymerase specialized sigma24 family protein